MKIHNSLHEIIEAVQGADMNVHTSPETSWNREARFVYVTQDGKPGIALVQVSGFPSLEPPVIDVPVKPNRLYGSLVGQDYSGTVEDAVRLLSELMDRDMVVPRFVGPHVPVPVDRRVPEDAEEVSL